MADAILLQGAGGGTGSDECTAGKAQVLEGYTAVTSDSDDEAAAGTMANNGAQTATLKAGGSYTIPEGYHNGGGSVKAEALSSQTSGDATAANILSGKTAWVNGSEVTGSMANNGDQSATLAAGGSKTIPAGYTSGGTVSAQSLSAQTSGTATAANILSGKTAWVNGSEVTGSMANIASAETAKSVVRDSAGNICYRMSVGAHVTYSSSIGYPEIKASGSKFGNATAADVVSGKTFTSASGLKVSGTIPKKLYSYYNKTTYGTTTVNDTKYICFNALDTGYYYNDSSNSSWAPELRVSEENFKTIARNTGLCVTPGDWEVFRDGAFQTDKIGIAPYYYYVQGYKSNYNSYSGGGVFALTKTVKNMTIGYGGSEEYGIFLNRWIPKSHISAIKVSTHVAMGDSGAGYIRGTVLICSKKTKTLSYAGTKTAWLIADFEHFGRQCTVKDPSGTVDVTLTPNDDWPDLFSLGFVSPDGSEVDIGIRSITLAIK